MDDRWIGTFVHWGFNYGGNRMMTQRPMPLKVECITFPEKRGPTTLAGPHGEAPGLVGSREE